MLGPRDEKTSGGAVQATGRHVGEVQVGVELLLCVLALYLQFKQVLDAIAQGCVADVRLVPPTLCHGSWDEGVLDEQTRRLG